MGGREELIKLRVAMARIAQSLGLALRIPGTHQCEDPAYEALVKAAKTCERGWHNLANAIINEIQFNRIRFNQIRARRS